jgi:hypothetical protein
MGRVWDKEVWIRKQETHIRNYCSHFNFKLLHQNALPNTKRKHILVLGTSHMLWGKGLGLDKNAIDMPTIHPGDAPRDSECFVPQLLPPL